MFPSLHRTPDSACRARASDRDIGARHGRCASKKATEGLFQQPVRATLATKRAPGATNSCGGGLRVLKLHASFAAQCPSNVRLGGSQKKSRTGVLVAPRDRLERVRHFALSGHVAVRPSAHELAVLSQGDRHGVDRGFSDQRTATLCAARLVGTPDSGDDRRRARRGLRNRARLACRGQQSVYSVHAGRILDEPPHRLLQRHRPGDVSDGLLDRPVLRFSLLRIDAACSAKRPCALRHSRRRRSSRCCAIS